MEFLTPERPCKRRRHHTDPTGGTASSDPIDTASSTAFSVATSRMLLALHGDDLCWYCGSEPVEKAHVLAQCSVKTFMIRRSRGLLNIMSLSSVDNGILLCPTCHKNFNHPTERGLLIVPLDLDFFFEEERRDSKRRRAAYEATGIYPARVCPTIAHYQSHSGLYQGYMARFYLPKRPPLNALELQDGIFFEPRYWHGDPMAILYNALLSNNHEGFPSGLRIKLTHLQCLWEENDKHITTAITPMLKGPRTHSRPSTDPSKSERPDGSRKSPPSPNGDPSEEPDKRSSAHSIYSHYSSMGHPAECCHATCPDDRNISTPVGTFPWARGPQSTSQDAIEWWMEIEERIRARKARKQD